MFNKLHTCFCILLFQTLSFSQTTENVYVRAFEEHKKMLNGELPIDFKRAVFVTENAYLNQMQSYDQFLQDITQIKQKLQTFVEKKQLTKYATAYNWAVFSYLKDSSELNNGLPYQYDFQDFLGQENWESMFVLKLLKSKKGNCHSIPILYKILCNELGVQAELALAPNHLYIKHIDEKGQWVNLELTSGGFPRDAWLIDQLGISLKAIQKGAYMRPITDKESIALSLFDLACGYEYLYGYDSLYLDMVESALNHFPTCIPLWQCALNYWVSQKSIDQVESEKHILEIKQKMFDLGFQEQSIEDYKAWVEKVTLLDQNHE